MESYGDSITLDQAIEMSTNDFNSLEFAIGDEDWIPPSDWLGKIFRHGTEMFILIRQNNLNFLIFI